MNLDAVYRQSAGKLRRLAYRHLASVSEAEDAVQEAFIKLAPQTGIANPEAWLARTLTNLCIDRLRSEKARRSAYPGPFLPEPAAGPDFNASDAEIGVDMAVMRCLETLSSAERAAFFLHDLFGIPYDDIAATLRRTPTACRQLVSRARKAVRSGHARQIVQPEHLDRLVRALSEASISGNPAPLARILAEDIELVSDGGGKVTAARNVLRGPDHAAQFLLGILRKNAGRPVSWTMETVNGAPALAVRLEGRLDNILSVAVNQSGEISGIYIQRNPDKLARFATAAVT